MNHNIHLPDNHTRGLSSSLMLVEKSLSEMQDLFLKQNDACCYEVVKDVDNDVIAKNISVIQEAKTLICELAGKYGTAREEQSLQRIIDAKRTKIWEILTDSLSRKIKGYGTFPKKYADEYDSDIGKLIEITNKINYSSF
jgi:hypothetical protein